MVPNRNRISLYQDAKASLRSLFGQSAIVFVGLIVMLLLTGGKPSGFIVGLSFVVGVGFVAWREVKRLTEFEPAEKSQIEVVKPSTVEELLRLLKLDESPVNVNKIAILRVLLSKGISNEQLQKLTLEVVEADKSIFVELAKIAGLDLAEDFKYANLSYAKISGANFSGADLRYANLSGANLSYAILRGADLRYADLSGADLRGVYLNGAILSDAILAEANLGDADLMGANLSGANVEDARFGYNEGIDETLKQDLIRRGAIFIDSPGDRSRVTTSQK